MIPRPCGHCGGDISDRHVNATFCVDRICQRARRYQAKLAKEARARGEHVPEPMPGPTFRPILMPNQEAMMTLAEYSNRAAEALREASMRAAAREAVQAVDGLPFDEVWPSYMNNAADYMARLSRWASGRLDGRLD